MEVGMLFICQETSDQETWLVHFHRVCALSTSKSHFFLSCGLTATYSYHVSNARQIPCKWNNFFHLFEALNNTRCDERVPATCRMGLDMWGDGHANINHNVGVSVNIKIRGVHIHILQYIRVYISLCRPSANNWPQSGSLYPVSIGFSNFLSHLSSYHYPLLFPPLNRICNNMSERQFFILLIFVKHEWEHESSNAEVVINGVKQHSTSRTCLTKP